MPSKITARLARTYVAFAMSASGHVWTSAIAPRMTGLGPIAFRCGLWAASARSCIRARTSSLTPILPDPGYDRSCITSRSPCQTLRLRRFVCALMPPQAFGRFRHHAAAPRRCASLLATATAATLVGLQAMSSASHGFAVPRRLAWRITLIGDHGEKRLDLRQTEASVCHPNVR